MADDWRQRNISNWPWTLEGTEEVRGRQLSRLRWALPHLIGQYIILRTSDATFASGLLTRVTWHTIWIGHPDGAHAQVQIESIRDFNCEFLGVRMAGESS